MKKKGLLLLSSFALICSLWQTGPISSVHADDTEMSEQQADQTPAEKAVPNEEAAPIHQVLKDSAPVSDVALEKFGTVLLQAEEGLSNLQWQIEYAPNQWANIANETGSTLEVTFPMVENLLNDSKVNIRYKQIQDEADNFSFPVSVQVKESSQDASNGNQDLVNPEQPEENPVEQEVNEEPTHLPVRKAPQLNAAFAPEEEVSNEDTSFGEEGFGTDDSDNEEEAGLDWDNDSSEDPADQSLDLAAPTEEDLDGQIENYDEPVTDPQEEPEPAQKVTVLVQFLKESNQQPVSDPRTYTITKDTPLQTVVDLPSIQGYKARFTNTENVKLEGNQLKIDYSSVDSDQSIKVEYVPDLVNVTFRYLFQNVDDNGYSTDPDYQDVIKQGFTDNPVSSVFQKKEREGFIQLLYNENELIAADGKSLVEIRYDRKYYLISFNLNGGYGVEPIYARYGTPIGKIEDPKRKGYTFDKWSGEIPSTVPAQKLSFVANWKPALTTYTVVYWYENADKDNESDEKPGETVVYSDVKNDKLSGEKLTLNDLQALANSQSVKNTIDAQHSELKNYSSHFVLDTDRLQETAVSGDGSTVINIYFKRRTYTLTFKNVDVLTCKEEEHKHSYDSSFFGNKYGGCYPKDGGRSPICGKIEHTHSSRCYQEKDFTFTDIRFDQNLDFYWNTSAIKNAIDEGYSFTSNLTQLQYTYLEKMPGSDLILTKYDKGSYKYEWYYWVEQLPNGEADYSGFDTKTDNGKRYYKIRTGKATGGYSLGLTYDEDYFPISGFKQRDKDVPSFSSGRKADLYYLRMSYDVTFTNHDSELVGLRSSLLYEQKLKKIENKFTEPAYPSGLEPGAYEFDGWFTTPFFREEDRFTNGGSMIYNEATMPAGNLHFYAHWIPKKHTVRFFLDEKLQEQVYDPQIIPHGSIVNPVSNPVNGKYEFVNWFYREGTTEKAFDLSMPVNRDLDLYAKWSSNTIVPYTIYYKTFDEEGKEIEIAPATIGSGLGGSFLTFEAKTGNDLNPGYTEGYFPDASSRSLTLSLEDGADNSITFWYSHSDPVGYTVRYVDKETGNDLHNPKIGETSASIITEDYVRIPDYVPDSMQKRLIITQNPEQNVLIFYYVKDASRAAVLIQHYLQNSDQKGYTLDRSEDRIEFKDTEITVNALQYPGYHFSQVTVNDAVKSDQTVTETIKEDLVIKFYYDLSEYDYTFYHKEQNTGMVLAPETSGKELYGKQVAGNSLEIPGYECINSPQVITIRDAKNGTEKNEATLLYKEKQIVINYQVAGNTGGTLSNDTDTVTVYSGSPIGSEPTANPNYRFVGWYKDEACTTPVDSSWVANGKIIPQKTVTYKVNGVDKPAYEAATYYAKFAPNTQKLTIKKSLADDLKADKDLAFIFNVINESGASIPAVVEIREGQISGEVTLELVVGKYTILEDESWSWQYSVQPDDSNSSTSREVSLLAESPSEVVFTNVKDNNNWFSDENRNQNIFKGVSK